MLDSQNAEQGVAGGHAQAAFPVTTQVLTGLEGLQSLRADWIALQAGGGAFSRYEWFEAYARDLADAPGSMAFVSCRDSEGPLAIVPAMPGTEAIRPFGKLHALTLGAHSHLTILDFPMSSRANPALVGTAVINALRRTKLQWSVVRWLRSPVGGNAWRVATALGWRAFVREAPPSNGFDTTVPFETLHGAWSKNLRTSLQKSRKRLNEAQPWSVSSNRGRPDVERFFEEFLRLEASGWKGQSGTGSAIALNEKYRAFYGGLLRGTADGIECEVTLLEAGGHAIAAQFSVTAQRCKHVLKIGYDEAAGKFSPGQVLMEEVLKRACADASLDRVSLVTDMPWHRTWRPQPAENFEGLIFRTLAMTSMYHACLKAVQLLRVLRERFTPSPPAA